MNILLFKKEVKFFKKNKIKIACYSLNTCFKR